MEDKKSNQLTLGRYFDDENPEHIEIPENPSVTDVIKAVNSQSSWTACSTEDQHTVRLIPPSIGVTTVTVTSFERGHETEKDEKLGVLVYKDIRVPVTGRRSCRRCGQLPTPEGYDACAGFIPGAQFACCGHGISAPYLILKNGEPADHPSSLILKGNSESSALFSSCEKYRYCLFRGWERGKKVLIFIGLNPSTADEFTDDPTVRRCINYAKAWGYGALLMLNIFAFRATDPRHMKAQADPVGPLNDWTLLKYAQEAGAIVCGWGAHGAHNERSASVVKLLSDYNLQALKITATGEPSHPLYLKRNLLPFIFRRRDGAKWNE